jgi:hypothetical protein
MCVCRATEPSHFRSISPTKAPKNMVQEATPLASSAEAHLSAKYSRLREPTKYIATFITASGRHLALTRQAKGLIHVWVEQAPAHIDGCTLKNLKNPGQPYSPEQPRSSNLTTASKRLGLGNQAFYVECATLASFLRLVDWYFAT